MAGATTFVRYVAIAARRADVGKREHPRHGSGQTMGPIAIPSCCRPINARSVRLGPSRNASEMIFVSSRYLSVTNPPRDQARNHGLRGTRSAQCRAVSDLPSYETRYTPPRSASLLRADADTLAWIAESLPARHDELAQPAIDARPHGRSLQDYGALQRSSMSWAYLSPDSYHDGYFNLSTAACQVMAAPACTFAIERRPAGARPPRTPTTGECF